ncbi:hypothetical protein [Bacillus tuaregi]|uniref:hypothetical protein n=1 Tax=Bacillus tuaregi TaxID=1816695 RepID=UPI0008F934F1|nr:hypothetical protein [Bacillus tuaregi]
MKFVKWILIPVVIVLAVGFGVYHFGKDYAIEKVTEKMESSGKMDEVKEMVKSNPDLVSFIKEVETNPEARQYLQNQTTTEQLPFDTKEEAAKVVVDRVGITELNDIVQKAKSGTVTQEEIIQQYSSEFSEEELMALKIIAYKELYGNNQ